jgi:HPt (histidine-containing phosphotransfer) domain-containing protein
MKAEFSSGLLVESTFNQFSALDRPTLVEIISTFLSESQYSMTSIEGLLKNGTSRELNEHIHKFKGSCGLAGAGMMYSVLEEMNNLCRTGEIGSSERSQLKSYFSSLKDYWKKTQTAMVKLYSL